jgi:hypothetical protein
MNFILRKYSWFFLCKCSNVNYSQKNSNGCFASRSASVSAFILSVASQILIGARNVSNKLAGLLKNPTTSSYPNPRPSGLQHIASTNYATAWPRVFEVIKQKSASVMLRFLICYLNVSQSYSMKTGEVKETKGRGKWMIIWRKAKENRKVTWEKGGKKI